MVTIVTVDRREGVKHTIPMRSEVVLSMEEGEGLSINNWSNLVSVHTYNHQVSSIHTTHYIPNDVRGLLALMVYGGLGSISSCLDCPYTTAKLLNSENICAYNIHTGNYDNCDGCHANSQL